MKWWLIVLLGWSVVGIVGGAVGGVMLQNSAKAEFLDTGEITLGVKEANAKLLFGLSGAHGALFLGSLITLIVLARR